LSFVVFRVVDLPHCLSEVNPYLLTSEQLKFYEENGYVAGIKILTPEQVIFGYAF